MIQMMSCVHSFMSLPYRSSILSLRPPHVTFRRNQGLIHSGSKLRYQFPGFWDEADNSIPTMAGCAQAPKPRAICMVFRSRYQTTESTGWFPILPAHDNKPRQQKYHSKRLVSLKAALSCWSLFIQYVRNMYSQLSFISNELLHYLSKQ